MYPSLEAAIVAAWASAGLNESVGPLSLDQAIRGSGMPYVVFNELLSVPRYTMGSGYYQDTRYRFQIVTGDEGEAKRLWRIMEGKMSSYFNQRCPIPPNEDGIPFSSVFYGGQTFRPKGPWVDGTPRAIRMATYRVRANCERVAR